MFVLLLACACAAASPSAIEAGDDWRTKVDPWILERGAAAGEVGFLVVLRDQAGLEGAAGRRSKEALGRFVVERLRAAAARSQAPLLAMLAARGVEHRSFWVANMVWVRGSLDLVMELARRPDVARVEGDVETRLALPPAESLSWEAAAGIEWNVSLVAAPDFWDLGFTGQGVVVGGQDTGYDWDHPALIEQYRGWDGVTADHDHDWHDAIHSGGGVCGADSPEPCDDHNHGTHTLGTMVGDDGGANRIGVAPGARWIGCRNMDRGVGSVATYSECFQYFLAPTDLGGENPDPSAAPHVINNSWYCSAGEGCTTPDVLRAVVENVRAAGIVVVAAAGNSGSDCSSISGPPAIYEAVFTVGATDSLDDIAFFSSRGDVAQDGSHRLKPDVTAPGVGIRSSVRGGTYQSGWNGTSMASPHVAGQVALLLSARPDLAGDVDAIERCIRATALPLEATQTCGGVPSGVVPNNVYGHGRLRLVWPLPPACDPSLVFADDYESGDLSAWSGSVL